MFYKALGFAVWKGAKWYLGKRARALTSGRLLAACGAAAVVATAIGIGARRDSSRGQ